MKINDKREEMEGQLTMSEAEEAIEAEPSDTRHRSSNSQLASFSRSAEKLFTLMCRMFRTREKPHLVAGSSCFNATDFSLLVFQA